MSTSNDPMSSVTTVVIAAAAGKQIVVTGHTDGTLLRWDLATRSRLGDPMLGHDGWIKSAALATMGGTTALVTAGGATARVWDVASGEAIGDAIFCHHGGPDLVAAAVVRGEVSIVTLSSSNWAEIWEFKAPHQRKKEPWSGWAGTRALLLEDGDPSSLYAVMDDDDGEAVLLRLWNMLEGNAIGPPLRGGDLGTGVMRTPVALTHVGGRLVLVSGAGSDGALRIWDVLTGSATATFSGHQEEVTAVAVRGATAVSGDDEGTIRVWDLAAGQLRGEPLRAHGKRVNSVALAEVDGKLTAVSGGRDGTLTFTEL